jgi:tetratricopeptide (TPR) repeat protein
MTVAPKTLLQRAGLFAVLVLIAYGGTLTHGFVWDDLQVIVNNPLLAKLGNIPGFFLSEDKVVSATGYYRPLTYVSFALDRAVWGLNPLGYNLTNLVLHLLVVLFFYLVLAEIFHKERLALYAAVLFALHPLAVETVNFHAGGRNTLLAACFMLLSLFCYLRERSLASLFFFTLAIFSKEFALLLPAVFLYLDRFVKRREAASPGYLPYLAAIGCYLVLRSLAVQQANFLASFRFSARLLLTPYLAIRYLVNMIWPFQLRTLYDEQITITLGLVCLLLVCLLIAVIVFLRRQRELCFADFWFLVFLLPVVNLIPINSSTLMADRYAYFSLMGFALALALLISRLGRGAAWVGICLLAVLFSWTDIRQSRIWVSEETLFGRMTQDAPGMSLGWRNLALYYYHRGELTKAERQLAVAVDKSDLSPEAQVGAASFFLEFGKAERAESLLVKALQQAPSNPESYLLLERISRERGDRAGALAWLAKAQQAIPGFSEQRSAQSRGFVAEGEAFAATGMYRNGANMFWRAALLDPSNSTAAARLEEARRRIGGPAR